MAAWHCDGRRNGRGWTKPDDEDAQDLKDGGAAYDRSQEQYAVNEGDKSSYYDYIDEFGFEGRSALGAAGEDSFAAVKPWLNRIVAPSAVPVTDVSVPDSQLELDWVYGYRGQDCTNNVLYNSKGHIIYFVAKVVIVYDREKQLQHFMLEHTDDVVSIAIPRWRPCCHRRAGTFSYDNNME